MAKTNIKKAAQTTVKKIEKAGIVTEKAKGVSVRVKEDIGKAVNTDADTPEQYAAQFYQEKTHSAINDAVYQFNKAGKKSVTETKKNIETAKYTLEDIKERRACRRSEQSAKSADNIFQNAPDKTANKTAENISKNAPKTAKNSIRMGNNSAVKNSEKTIKAVNKATKTAKVSATGKMQKSVYANKLAVSKFTEKSRKAAEYARATARETAKYVKAGLKAAARAFKMAVNAVKSLINAIIAGGWIAVVVIIILCLVGAVAASFYGIFFSTETSETGLNITSVIQEINADYDNKIDEIKSKSSYDEVEINGSKANWKDILSVYSVKVSTDADNPQETATIDESKKSILSDIFWDMNSIDSKVETRTQTKEITTTDQNGNEVRKNEEVTIKVLTISISSKTADEMASQYSFTDKQKEYLAELMSESNDKLWASIIFNRDSNKNDIDIGSLDFGDETVNDTQRKIVAVATNSESYGISAKSGYCQAWVADVYQAVTGSRGSAHCALCAADMWAVSQDFSKIQVGATVYGYASNPYGHVGIYIGNGQVIHNLSGTVKVQSLESWVNDFKGFAWGWENGKNLLTD